MSLRSRLNKPLWLVDGRCLRTVGDAIEIVLEMDEHALAAAEWAQVPELLKTACCSGRDDHIALATSAFERALCASAGGGGALADHEKKPPAPSLRRKSRQKPAARRAARPHAPARAKAKRR